MYNYEYYTTNDYCMPTNSMHANVDIVMPAGIHMLLIYILSIGQLPQSHSGIPQTFPGDGEVQPKTVQSGTM